MDYDYVNKTEGSENTADGAYGRVADQTEEE
jgi:hypothetical protein